MYNGTYDEKSEIVIMSKYSNVKKLRLVAKRLIIDSSKKWKKGMINIITAGTGVGKTYNIMNTLIPSDIEEGYNKFLFLTVYTDNVSQDSEKMENTFIENGVKAKVTTDVKTFLGYNGKLPIVLVSTVAGAVNGGTDNENSVILINFLKDEKFVLYWDEAHFGGSSSPETALWNTGHRAIEYKASYYEFAEALALLENAKVTGFTATPLFEHKGLIPNINSKMYNLLVKKEDWATQEELTEITSQLRDISVYNPNKLGFEKGIQLALNDYLAFSKNLELTAEIINSHEPLLKLAPKTIMTLNAGANNENTETSLNIYENIDVVKDWLRGKRDETSYILGKADKDGYFIGNIQGDWNKLTGDYAFTEFVQKMEDSNDPLRFIFHIEKFKFGLNVPNISHEVHSRERNQVGENKVTVSILQIFGRAVRTNFGITDLDVNFVSDAVDWLLKDYKDSDVFDELREYMMLQNSHTFFVPDTETYQVAIPEWKDDYSAPLSMSQFNNVDRNGFKKNISASKQERDAAYKAAQKDRCERENCKCFEDFVTHPPIASEEFDLSEEERLVNYKKGLQVDHVDRNLNNLAPENLKTYCPNAHSGKTMKYEDYMPK